MAPPRDRHGLDEGHLGVRERPTRFPGLQLYIDPETCIFCAAFFAVVY